MKISYILLNKLIFNPFSWGFGVLGMCVCVCVCVYVRACTIYVRKMHVCMSVYYIPPGLSEIRMIRTYMLRPN